MKSRHLAPYLEENDRLGFGKGRTISTYLHRALTQKEKRGVYTIERLLRASLVLDGAIAGPSVRGGKAYYSRQNEEAVAYAVAQKMGGSL